MEYSRVHFFFIVSRKMDTRRIKLAFFRTSDRGICCEKKEDDEREREKGRKNSCIFCVHLLDFIYLLPVVVCTRHSEILLKDQVGKLISRIIMLFLWLDGCKALEHFKLFP